MPRLGFLHAVVLLACFAVPPTAVRTEEPHSPREEEAPLGTKRSAGGVAAPERQPPPRYFGIQVVDAETGRGVPLVELKTVNDILLYTDSSGWAAFDEPGLMGKEVYFHASSPGYRASEDGFGFQGGRWKAVPGETVQLKIRRTQIAERLVRLTGQGIHRDAALLGKPFPANISNLNAGVMGQDSVQTAPFLGKLFWLWGDTNIPGYPLGNFHTTSAFSPLPGKEGFDPEKGVPYQYFMAGENDKEPGQEALRKMAPSKEPGPMWLFGLFSIPDENGAETLVVHFSRHPSLERIAEHGLMQFDPALGRFKKILDLPLTEKWRHPQGNAFKAPGEGGDGEYIYFCAPFAHTRVRARWVDVIDPAKYEAFAFDPQTKEYRWTTEEPPTTQEEERKLRTAGTMPPEKARYPMEAADRRFHSVVLHGGSIAWNAYRKKWTIVGNAKGGKDSASYLGEVWYAEADSPTGPWNKAIQIATHPHYTFYNPRQHPFMQADGGRKIYFEGTYTKTFSNNPIGTPRYEYNQLLYRLDIDDYRLKAAR